jgi:hypothetical protein
LREALPDLVGLALFDRLSQKLEREGALQERAWTRREIENYLCTRETLKAWAAHAGGEQRGPLSASDWAGAMEESIGAIERAMETLGKGSPWEPDTKVSDDFLGPLFTDFFRRLGLPNTMNKSDYNVLARFVPEVQLGPEVRQVLDALVEVASRACPVGADESA